MGNVHSIHRAESESLGERVRPTFAKAAAVSAGLSLLFVVVYGGCNWITAQRSDVGLLNFEWESAYPVCSAADRCLTCRSICFLSRPHFCAEQIGSCRLSRNARSLRSLPREFVSCFFRSGLRFHGRTLAAGLVQSSIGFAEWTCLTICFRHSTSRSAAPRPHLCSSYARYGADCLDSFGSC